MYDRTAPPGKASQDWAKKILDALSKKYPAEKEFWKYMEK